MSWSTLADDMATLIKKNTAVEVVKIKRKGKIATKIYMGCPVCSRQAKKSNKYCPGCGQKLKWSDKK